MTTYADLFTGFGGATVGAKAAGLTPLWGVEYDAKIAAVANANLGGHVYVANILDVDPHTLPRVDVLHASPPCPNFSVAKSGGSETALDLDLARKVVQFVDVLQPRVVTLENVYAYRQSQSWLTIQDALFAAGYWVSIEHVNAADYGVPQTRQRMIVRAVRGGWVPYLPEPVRWVGWYEAIEDLLAGLPDSQFAPWQLKRLPDELRTLAFGNNAQEWGDSVVYANEPFHTVTSQTGGRARAILIGGGNRSESFLQFAKENRPTIPGRRFEDEPSMTVSATASVDTRAFIIGKNADKFGDGIRYADEPVQTIGANEHGSKAYTRGRVVAMTPRCLARFQSFPDDYELPESKTLAAKGIGNAVAPLMYRRILEGLTN